MWDMQDRSRPKPQDLREGHDWQASTGIFFDGGRKLLTSGGDNTTLVWDAAQGKEIQRLGKWYDEGTGWRGVAAVSHDGKWVATGSNPSNESDNKRAPILAKLWNVSSGTQVFGVEGYTTKLKSGPEQSEATALDFSPNDALLLVGDQWGRCKLIETATGKTVKAFAAQADTIVAAKFLADEQTVLTAGADGLITKWDVTTSPPRQVWKLRHGFSISVCAVSADGQHIIAAGDPKKDPAMVRLWNITTGKLEGSLTKKDALDSLGQNDAEPDATPVVRSVEFHPTDPVALITLYDQNSSTNRCRICQWKWKENEQQLRLVSKPRADVSMAVYSPRDHERMLEVGGRGARLVALASNSRNPVTQAAQNMTFDPPPGINSVSFSADGHSLASAGSNGSIKIWELGPDRHWVPGETLPARPGNRVNSLRFDPKDSNLFVTAGSDGVKIWRRTNEGWKESIIKELSSEKADPKEAIFSDDGQYLVVASSGGPLVWDRNANALLPSPAGITNAKCVAISSKGGWIAVGCGNESRNKIWLYSVNDPAHITEVGSHPADVTSLCFSPSTNRLFTASEDFTVKIWDISTIVTPPKASDESSASRAVSHTSNHELMTLAEHQGSVTSVQLLPDHRTILTTGRDGQAILWPCKMEEGAR